MQELAYAAQNFKLACLDDADLSGANFDRADFTDAHMVGAILKNIYAVKSNFYDACLQDSIIEACAFVDCDMSKVKFTGETKLNKIVFQRSKLEDTLFCPLKAINVLIYGYGR